jgi:hypothetical protein
MSENFAQTLYRILPAYYRERDEIGDLKAYLTGCGDLLDDVYATLRQRYADNFPDNPPTGSDLAPAQDWLLPYFSDLVDATLVSPLPDGRRDELANAISWRQGKGTLNTIDGIIEAIGQTEAVVQEGWQRVAMTPRIGQPLRPAVSFGYAQEPEAGNPGNMARHPDLPAATVDMRCPSRAIETDPNTPGAQRIRVDGAQTVWRQGSHNGAPCFAGSYEDVSPRTPDMRTPDWQQGHYHPRRVLAYVPPPSGFFGPTFPDVTWADTPNANYLDHIEIDTSQPGVIVHRNKTLDNGPFVPVRVRGVVRLDDAETQADAYRFEGLSFNSNMVTADAQLSFDRCSVNTVRTGRNDLLAPAITMTACLGVRLVAARGRVQIVGSTVLGRVVTRGIEASDCVFNDLVHASGAAGQAPQDGGCIRFSRIEPGQPAGIVQFWQNTTEAPVFFETRYRFQHVGVLSPATHPAILTGAEDNGEMGAFHDARHAAIRAAILTKLSDFLPIGQEAVLIPDIRLTNDPWS